MQDQGTNANPTGPKPRPTGRQILQMGVWNYISGRYAPKSTAGRWAFDIGVLAIILLPIAILAKLASN
jgi:hypothetical protein